MRFRQRYAKFDEDHDKLQLKQMPDGRYTTRYGGVYDKVWTFNAEREYTRVDSLNGATLKESQVVIVEEFTEEPEKGCWRSTSDNPESKEWGRFLA